MSLQNLIKVQKNPNDLATEHHFNTHIYKIIPSSFFRAWDRLCHLVTPKMTLAELPTHL